MSGGSRIGVGLIAAACALAPSTASAGILSRATADSSGSRSAAIDSGGAIAVSESSSSGGRSAWSPVVIAGSAPLTRVSSPGSQYGTWSGAWAALGGPADSTRAACTTGLPVCVTVLDSYATARGAGGSIASASAADTPLIAVGQSGAAHAPGDCTAGAAPLFVGNTPIDPTVATTRC